MAGFSVTGPIHLSGLGDRRTTNWHVWGRHVTTESLEARFTMLYEKHYHEVLAYCTRRIGRDDADDVTADVFAVAWRRIDTVELSTARPWLYGIARGVLANRFRSGRRHRQLVGKVQRLAATPNESLDVQVLQRAADREVLDVVRSLKPADREVLLLAAWEGLTGSEIADALGISVSAAEQRLHRAKRRLARKLSPADAPGFASEAVDEGGGL